MTVHEFAIKVGKTSDEILSLCHKLNIDVSDKDDILSDDDTLSLVNDLQSSFTSSCDGKTVARKKPDISIDPECLFNECIQVKDVVEKLKGFFQSVNSTDISNVELSTSCSLDESKNNISSMVTEATDLNDRIVSVKTNMVNNDPELALLFSWLEGDYFEEDGSVDEDELNDAIKDGNLKDKYKLSDYSSDYNKEKEFYDAVFSNSEDNEYVLENGLLDIDKIDAGIESGGLSDKFGILDYAKNHNKEAAFYNYVFGDGKDNYIDENGLLDTDKIEADIKSRELSDKFGILDMVSGANDYATKYMNGDFNDEGGLPNKDKMKLYLEKNNITDMYNIDNLADKQLSMDTHQELVAEYENLLSEKSAELGNIEKQLKEAKNNRILIINEGAMIGVDEERLKECDETIASLNKEYNDLTQTVMTIKGMKDISKDNSFNVYFNYDDFNNNSSFKPRIANYEVVNDVTLKKDANSFKFYDKAGNEIKDVSNAEMAMYFSSLDKKTANYLADSSSFENAYNTYQYMSDSEKKIASYLLNTGNAERLEEYFDFKLDFANQRHGLELASGVIQDIDGNYNKVGFEGILDERPYTEADAFIDTMTLLAKEGFFDGVNNFFDGLKNLSSADGVISAQQYKTSYIMNNLQERYGDDELAKIFSTGSYELSNSIGNMVPSIAVGTVTGIPLLGSVTMGLSAAGNSREQGLQSGMTETQAWTYGILSGASETTFEYLFGGITGLSKLEKLSNSLPGWKGFLTGMFKEGMEETFQSVLDPMIETMVTGHYTEINWGEVLKSGIYGVLTAGILNGGQVVIGKVAYDISDMSADTMNSLVNKYGSKDLSNPVVKAELQNDLIEYKKNDKVLLGDRKILLKAVKELDVLTTDGLNSFFESYNMNNKNYGSDQGFLDTLYKYENRNGQTVKFASDEYFRLKNKLIRQGFTKHGASMVMSGLDSVGACSYASIVNGIFSSFKNNPIEFKQIFGYEMTTNINGKKVLNTGELLLDLYTFINNTQNGGKLFKTDVDGTIDVVQISSDTDIFGRAKLEADNQQYMSGGYGIKEKLITSFLKSKSSLLSAKTEKLFDHYSSVYLSDVKMKEIVNKVTASLNSNYNIGLGIYRSKSEIRMISLSPNIPSTSTFTWDEGSGHAVFVTGVDNRGFIVSSWGNKYLIPFSDLQSGSFVISRWNIDGLTQINQKVQLLDNSFISAWKSQTKKYGLDRAIDSFQKFLDTGNFNYITRDENARNLLMKFSIDEIRNFVRVNNNGSLSIRAMVYGEGYK